MKGKKNNKLIPVKRGKGELSSIIIYYSSGGYSLLLLQTQGGFA